MKKTLNILLSIGAVVVGIIFVITGIHQLTTKDLYDSTATATIVDIQEEWQSAADPEDPDELVKTAYIDYEVDGTKYEHVLAPQQNDNYKVGDTVEILYQSKDPSKYSSKEIGKSAAIFIGLGAIVAIVGLGTAVRLFIKKQ